MITLKGSRIFVAGGSRGMGRAAALMAAEAGADVAVGYVQDAAAAEETVRQIIALGRKAIAMKADVVDESKISGAVERAAEFLGGFDGLVVSAGIYAGASIDEMTLEFWNKTLAVNLTGTFIVVKAILPHLRKTGRGGSIVIYTSIAGQNGSRRYSAYAASKGAQITFMKSLAKELAPDRIRVNCIAPGWTDTDLARRPIESIGRAKIEAEIPLGRIGRPEDVAGATVYLLSDVAQFVTGITLPVDGGRSIC